MLLVTGASGYLGRALLPSLQERFPDRSVQWAGRSGTERLLDLAQPAGFRTALKDAEVVVHCAGIAHTRAQSVDYEQLNVRASMALADAALANGARQFIYISSMNVVPPRAQDPHAPAATFEAPSTPYGQSKWRAEQNLEALMAGTPCELVIVRPALLYDEELTANLALLARWGRTLPFALPDAGGRTLLCRADLVELIGQLIEGRGANRSGPCRVAAFDGQCYSARRIAAALASPARLSLPIPVWRLAAWSWDCLAGNVAGATWQSIAGHHWCAEPSYPLPWRPFWTLERRVASRSGAVAR